MGSSWTRDPVSLASAGGVLTPEYQGSPSGLIGGKCLVATLSWCSEQVKSWLSGRPVRLYLPIVPFLILSLPWSTLIIQTFLE